ncbi:MAG: DUF1801 domain-containing protein [Bacteroidota bacterium]
MGIIEDFILGLDGQQKAIVSYLHDQLSEKHGLEGRIRYNIPFYYHRKPICYLNPIKKEGVELVFSKGALLSNIQGLLEVKNRKYVAGISCYQLEEIPLIVIDEIVQEAILLENIS